MDVAGEAGDVVEYQRKFRDYLTADMRNNAQWRRINNMLLKEQERLIVNINDLRRAEPELAKSLVDSPSKVIPAFEKVLNDEIRNEADASKSKRTYRIGFEGSFATHHVTPRGLNTSLMGTLVMVEGLVTRCTIVRPKLVRSVHYCEATKQFTQRTYRDATSLDGQPTGSVYPRVDDNGNSLTTEFGLCEYINRQIFTIQEAPEFTPAGQMPRSIDVVVEEDLVDACKPGDRVQVVGIYRSLAGARSGINNGFFKVVLLPNNVRPVGKLSQQNVFTELDVKNFRILADEHKKSKDIVDFLAKSVAPSIHGHEAIKRAVVLLLLGGRERFLPNGGHLRGDINMMMVGDPSTAKSQILRFVMNLAPMAVSTSGRGSTGVGLTAAVTMDPDTGERRLEAGAMVLADRGVVCIDEFDKMTESDRTAIHEVMEQQTVTVAKAGIHTTLNARCSVVAAANPIFGQYDPHTAPAKNIGMPDSLLSRFDLLFIVHDRRDSAIDRTIAYRVINSHMYKGAGAEEGIPVRSIVSSIIEDAELRGEKTRSSTEIAEVPMYQPYNKELHDGKKELLNVEFLKRYIEYAKKEGGNVQFTNVAAKVISDAYVKIRSQEMGKRSLPITARTLETMIRLSTAYAKARLAKRVSKKDAEKAVELLEYIMKNVDIAKIEEEEERKRQAGQVQPESDDEEEDEDDAPPARSTRRAARPEKTPEAAPAPAAATPVGSPKGRKRQFETATPQKKPRVIEDGPEDEEFDEEAMRAAMEAEEGLNAQERDILHQHAQEQDIDTPELARVRRSLATFPPDEAVPLDQLMKVPELRDMEERDVVRQLEILERQNKALLRNRTIYLI